MKIGIDARFLGPTGGIPRYVQQLVTHLEQQDQTNEYVIFLRRANWDLYEPRNPSFKKVLADVPWYGLAEQLRLPLIIRRERVDLMHFPHWNIPLLYRGRFVVTIHDLLLLHQNDPTATHLNPLMFRLKQIGYRTCLRSAVARACAILATSEFTKKDIVETLRIDHKKIQVTYQSPEHLPLKSRPVPGSVERPKPYLLYVGTAYPHKNLSRLISMFDIAQRRHPELESLHLILTGRLDTFYRELAFETKQIPNVIFYGEANDVELASLYTDARAFIFPSIFEGFGIPPLEAMQFGLPVAASNQTCLPEILDDAALLFDPNDDEAFIDAITRISTDELLRTRLSAAGPDHARQFSWEKCTDETRKIYARCAILTKDIRNPADSAYLQAFVNKQADE